MRYGGSGEGVYGGYGRISFNPIFTGQVKAADGAAAAPSYSFTSAPTIGIYTSSGALAFATNGVLRAQITGSGLFQLLNNPFDFSNSGDATVARISANSLRYSGDVTNTTLTSRTEINKAVTAFTNAAAKAVFTVTVPNAAHHAVLEVEIQGALGAGGAIGAGEAMATNTYKIAIVRTAGVATVATATAATHAVAVAVAGAATVTATAAVSAISGAVGATQTFTIDVTITKSGGSSDNHTCLAYAKLMNANATGITIA